MQKARPVQNPVFVVFIALMLASLLFVIFKFGVFDQMYQYYTMNSQARDLERRLQNARTQNENYNDVFEEYSRYYYTGFTEAETARVDRLEAIKIIDEYMLTIGFAGAYTITDNVISLNLKGITLTQTAELIDRLSQNDMVVAVPIQTAGSDIDKPQTVTMNVVLRKAGEEE